ncbi:MAG: DUF6868 family protein [Pseudomonadota bacterium]
MTLDTLTAFLGLCTLINLAFLIVSTLGVVLARERLIGIHGRLFGMADAALPAAYFRYLAGYKILIVTFNLTPWLALQAL